MIPYTDFLYFGVSLYALVPALLLGFMKRVWRAWAVIATAFMLVIQNLGTRAGDASPFNGVLLIAVYAVSQWLIAALFLVIRKRGVNRFVFDAAIVLGLLPLLAAKWASFSGIEYPLVFLGLSYVTFRSLDVLIGIQDGAVKHIDPLRYLVFLLFFPTLSSGPIDRYRRFSEDWSRERHPAEVFADIDGGIHRS